MEKENKFVAKIVEDAKLKKEQIKNDAKTEAENIIKEKEQAEKEFFASEKKTIKEEYKKMLENEKDTSFLEQTKNVLSAKQEILQDVFDLALQKLKKVSAKDYQTFLKNVLEKNAEMQDGLIISGRKGEKEKLAKLAVFKKKKLKILETRKEISGGVIIVSSIYEKDFSFEGLLANKFQNMSHEISKQLF